MKRQRALQAVRAINRDALRPSCLPLPDDVAALGVRPQDLSPSRPALRAGGGPG